jgi:hypothetical protein
MLQKKDQKELAKYVENMVSVIVWQVGIRRYVTSIFKKEHLKYTCPPNNGEAKKETAPAMQKD